MLDMCKLATPTGNWLLNPDDSLKNHNQETETLKWEESGRGQGAVSTCKKPAGAQEEPGAGKRCREATVWQVVSPYNT